jgi:hypothetical protein
MPTPSLPFRRTPLAIRTALAALAALALGGCSPLPIHTTFDTLTNETSKRASDLFTYSTFVSLSGLVPQNGAQLIFHQPDFYDFQGNSPSYAIGISPTRSFITERKFAMTGTNLQANANAVRTIRDGLESARLLSVQLAAANTSIEAAQTLLKTVGAAAPDASQADTLKTLLGSDVIGADGKVAADQAQAAIDDLTKRRDGLKTQIASALKAAKDQAARSNVVVTRWARERRSALGAYLSEAFAFSGQGHEAKSGVLVFGDLRVVTLHSGEDLVDMLRSAPRRFLAFATNAGIATFGIQARHMAYSADLDMQQAVAAQLRLSKEQLADLSKAFADLDQNYSASFGVAMDVSNSAFVTNSHVLTETRCFFPPALYTESIQREIAASDGYQDLYVVRAQIKNELLDAAIGTQTELSDIAQRCSSDGKRLDPGKSTQCKQDFAAWLAACQRAPATAPAALMKSAPPAAASAEEAARMFANQPYILGK